ncbi:MAG: ligand-binding sensor domain-containing protein [Aureispira sp.]
MTFKQAICTSILMISITTLSPSCKRQSNAPDPTISKQNIELGISVSKLDKTIWSIYQDKQSNFWFGSKDNGVFFYNGQLLKQLTKTDGLVSNDVRGIQEDTAGNLFFETTAGVSKFDGQSLTTLKIKEGDSSTNQWKLEPNDLWFRIGFNKRGPFRYDGEYLHYLKFPKAPQEEAYYSQGFNANYSPYGVYSIYKDSKGFMWFGTTSLGLCRFDGQTTSWHYENQLQTTPSGGDFGMRAIMEDKEGYFWFNNSRYRYNILANEGKLIQHKKEDGIGFSDENDPLEFPFFLSITQDDEGDIWMVTYDNGVWRNNGTELIHYPIKNDKMEVLLFTIYKDNKGTLWLGTHNDGVYKFNGTSFEKFEL